MRRSLRLILLVFTVLIATIASRCLADSRPLPPGPVKITVTGTLPASGKVGTEGSSEFAAHVADGSGKGEKVTWKWVATVIRDDPNSEDDDETGIGKKTEDLRVVWNPDTNAAESRLTLNFLKPGIFHVRLFVEFANPEANTIGVSDPRVFKITVSP